MSLKTGQTLDFATNLCNDLDSRRPRTDNADSLSLKRNILRPLGCVIHLARERVQTWYIWNILLREQAEAGHQVLCNDRLVAATGTDLPRLYRIIPVRT